MNKSGADTPPNVCLITLTLGHHAGRSGYHRLCDYTDADLIERRLELNLVQRIVSRLGRSLVTRSGMTWYQRRALILELAAGWKWVRARRRVFHFLYGENSYRYLGVAKAISASNRIVATFHTPRQRFYEVVEHRAHLKRLDRCVAVSSVQLEFLAELVGTERVTYVPHGIDTAFYTPAATVPDAGEPFTGIFVGRHLRDLDTLERTFDHLVDANRFRFHVVGSPELRQRFDRFDNVSCHSGISDDGLLRLYQHADALLMPLLDCTANNAILEAMACGLPIVTTNLPGARDYVDDSCGIFVKAGDDRGMADAFSGLSEDRERRTEMGVASRRRAEGLFSWERIAEEFRRVYQGTM